MTQENTNTIQGNTSFQSRLATYSTLAVAGVCAFAGASQSKADIVYSGPLNLSAAATSTGSFFNMTTFVFGTKTAAQAGNTAAPVVNLWGTSNTYSWFYPTTSTVNRFESNATNEPLELAAGATVNSTSVFGTSTEPGALTAAASGVWTAGTTGYLGVTFLSGTSTYYGWLQIMAVAPPTTANPIKVLGAAYDNTGAGIVVGAVPEPGSVGCLAAGAIGAASLAWRRRKTA